MNTVATETLQGTVEMVRLDETANWVGTDLIPFEIIAERLFDIEHEGAQAPLTVSLAKPFPIEAGGWACAYRIAGLGRTHVTPVGGGDSVHAIQLAMHMVNTQLTNMSRYHKITFMGGDDLGFGSDAAGPSTAKCPVMGMSLNS